MFTLYYMHGRTVPGFASEDAATLYWILEHPDGGVMTERGKRTLVGSHDATLGWLDTGFVAKEAV